jgi:hypothetical protein
MQLCNRINRIAVCRSKHVEPLQTFGIINSITKLHLVGIARTHECQISMSVTTTQLLSIGEFCKMRYDTLSVKSASANASFHTSNSKMPNFEL